jgi:hypothetical protein
MPKMTTPTPQPNPGSQKQAKDNDVASQQAAVNWVQADQAYKQSVPQVISDGGKGVSN